MELFWSSLWMVKGNFESWRKCINYFDLLNCFLERGGFKKKLKSSLINKNFDFFVSFSFIWITNIWDYLSDFWFELVWIYWNDSIEKLKSDKILIKKIVNWDVLVSFVFKGLLWVKDLEKIILVKQKCNDSDFRLIVEKSKKQIFEKLEWIL